MALRFQLLLMSIMLLNAQNICRAQVVEIKGFVRTTEGKPINDVFIHKFGKTDETGHFKIASDVLIHDQKTLIFDKKGFVPKVISLDASHRDLSIVLELERDNTVWDIPTCNYGKANRNRLVGNYLRLNVPKDMKFKAGVDADYIYYSIGLTRNGSNQWLRGGWGNLYGSTYPSGETLLKMEHYSYRRTSLGIDWRGVTKDGKFWRYLGASPLFETYYYETDSKHASDVFDKILDGICFQPKK